MGSTRFPGKVMRSAVGSSLIELMLLRISRAKTINVTVVATSSSPGDNVLVEHISALGYPVFRGSEEDVLDRFYGAATDHGADIIVRLTADCPLIDAEVIDEVVTALIASGADYASNINPPTFPDGLDAEAFTYAALSRAWKEAGSIEEREHVTPYLRHSGQFATVNVSAAKDHSSKRWTVDEPADFEVVQSVFEQFHPRKDFSWEEVINLYEQHPGLFAANRTLSRNQGAEMGKGQKLWNRARRVIPGGNMLLSKRPEMFLPEHWPAYYSRAEGCRVWDLDGREYIDMSIMGVGTNILGYGHPEVDEAVREVVAAGNLSTLNCPEEVYLAERMVELHPWADMVRFARTGGEANAIAVRIARAASGKDKVAVCGYHGWHDWYLAANLADDQNLSGHLLPGLEPKGVPQGLGGSVLPFRYNRLDELQALVRDHDIGVIKMEVSRSEAPNSDFLQSVRRLADANGIVLVFDECTSGFRETFGGLHLKYGVEPDLAIFGKALGNGYAITATIGRREVMEAAQSTFISSTFWTERIGPAAALATLQVMQRLRSWDFITQRGGELKAHWRRLAENAGLEIDIWGLPALAGFTLGGDDSLACKTLISQEMLKRGFLASNVVYACIAHTDAVVERYLENLEAVFDVIALAQQGAGVHALLDGPVCHSGFKRLN